MVQPSAPVRPPARGLLADKRVLVTAAAGTGIGFATAKRCVEEGARVLLSDRHARRLEAHARELADACGRAVPSAVCDVTRPSEVDALFERASDELGGLDVLINNAGLGLTCPLHEMSDEQWSGVLDVSLTGAFRCTRAALRHMIPRRRGAIVNIGSVVAWRAEAGQTAYAAAKAGVLALTRSAAMEAAEHGVRVNAVVPTLAMHPHLARVSSEEFLEGMARSHPLQRAAEPWEIGNAIVFLSSDLASYMTGEALSVSSQHP